MHWMSFNRELYHFFGGRSIPVSFSIYRVNARIAYVYSSISGFVPKGAVVGQSVYEASQALI